MPTPQIVLLAAGLWATGQPATDTVLVHCAEGVAGGRARVRVVVGSGALHEPAGAEGVAHLLEHLVLRPLDLDHNNGSTSWDYTDYVTAVPPTELATAAVALARELVAPRWELGALEKEREVVLRELEARDMNTPVDDPLFAGTIYARNLGGTSASVGRLTADDARAFHRAHYVRGNVGVVLTGATRCPDLVARVQRELEQLPPGAAAQPRREPTPLPGARPLPPMGESLFLAGYYWYDEDPQAEVTLAVVARHLQQRAMDELRAERGLTYSPEALVARRGRGGMLRFAVSSDRRASEVASWYDARLDELRTSPAPRALLERAVAVAALELEGDEVRATLAALRGEPAPATVLRTLDDHALRATLDRVLAEDRSFATTTRNIVAIVMMSLIGAAVLGYFVWLGRRLLREM